ncbi:unnamed protein product [Coffea canephora]|uniref:Uncharacterized protein n=1 Tax=Coffea canephora TaxID=49390 RepID=A0A068V4T5_COFCA|nr:unnamed protein product [Coffea canephora]
MGARCSKLGFCWWLSNLMKLPTSLIPLILRNVEKMKDETASI